MKLISVFLFLLCHGKIFADHKNHAVLANIGTFIIGNYEFGYEHRLDKNLSLWTGVYYYESRKVLLRAFSRGYSLGIGFAPKFHIYGNALKNSFYLAPSIRLGFLEHPPQAQDEELDRGILLRTGAIFGYAHVFSNGLMLDANAGLEHYHTFSITKKATRFQNEGPLLIRPTIGFNIGYAF